ncbi:MAG: Lrp/AsnC family transcriptional regulator [Lachnospiraceae bacterium]|nr:Lrp/AsnC family transcriptional regulator [Lachnospiraceae bacterium]
MYIEDIEEVDKAILRLLKENARLSYSEIGEKVGLSRVSVKNRMTALEQKGVIEGYAAIINPVAAPDGIRFFMDIETTPERFSETVDKLALFKANRQIYAVTGECRIMVTGYADTSAKLRAMSKQFYANLKGIRKFSIHEVVATYKDADGGVEYVREFQPDEGDSEQL